MEKGTPGKLEFKPKSINVKAIIQNEDKTVTDIYV